MSRRTTKQRRAAWWRRLEQAGHQGWIGTVDIIRSLPAIRGVRGRRMLATAILGLHRRGWRVSSVMDGMVRAARPSRKEGA